MDDADADACFTYYRETLNRPPTVFELWGWRDAAAEIRLSNDLDGTYAV